MGSIILYHGSQDIIERPEYGKGKPNNDCGRGFYCTEDLGLAKEWACKQGSSGYANKYELDLSGLKVLRLNSGEYSILHWLTLLVENRTFDIDSDVGAEAREFLIENYHLDLSSFDIIIGYRADDSYFSFASLFLNNGMTIEGLKHVMRLDALGEQVVLRSRKAFDSLRFVGFEKADCSIYYEKRSTRDAEARRGFREYRDTHRLSQDDVRVADLVTGRVGKYDPRL